MLQVENAKLETGPKLVERWGTQLYRIQKDLARMARAAEKRNGVEVGLKEAAAG
jgi:hypothetical protein